MKILWFIPTHGDSRYLGTSKGARLADLDYFKQVAIAADTLGYEGVLLPTGSTQPVQTARMAATLDRLAGGRVLVNLVTGGDPDELAGDGLHLSHEERYEVSTEFVSIWREVLQASHTNEAIDFDGKHLKVKGAKVLYPPITQPYPPLFFGGSSGPAHDLAASQCDTYLTWGETPEAVA